MQLYHTIAVLDDQQLRAGLQQRLATERGQLSEFLAYLSEIDARKLFAAWGYSSLFVFCTQELRLAENSAYRRIRAARAARIFPAIYALIASGKTHCTAVTMIAPYLTPDNADILLSNICGQSKRAVEALIARLAPQPDAPDAVRRLPAQSTPTTRTGASCGNCADTLFVKVAECGVHKPCDAEDAPEISAASGKSQLQPTMHIDALRSSANPATMIAQQFAPMRHEQMQPLSIDRIKFQFTASAAFREKFARAQALLWHCFPAGKLEDIFSAALDALLAKREPAQLGQRRRKRIATHNAAMHTPGNPGVPRTRHIPALIKREVWARDHQQCQFLSVDGTRCCEQRGLEIDHIQPFAIGGRSDDAANLRLLCRAHNQWRAQMGK